MEPGCHPVVTGAQDTPGAHTQFGGAGLETEAPCSRDAVPTRHLPALPPAEKTQRKGAAAAKIHTKK